MNNNLIFKIFMAFVVTQIVFLILRFVPFIAWVFIVFLVVYSIFRKSKPSLSPRGEQHRMFRSNGKDVIDVEYSEKEVR